MTASDRRALALAACLALLAGYVDSLGFLRLRGFFVSFMSGNSTQLGVGAAQADRHAASTTAALIGLFVLGVVGGALLRTRLGGRRAPMLWLVALLLAAGGLAASLGAEIAALAAATLAMGLENLVVQKAGQVSVSVTYMTGTLVKMGEALAQALTGGARLGWLPYLLLWSALIAGAVVGASLFPLLHLQGLWLAALWAGGLALADGAWPEEPRHKRA